MKKLIIVRSEGIGMDILMQEALEKHKDVERENVFVVDTEKEACEALGRLKGSIIYKENANE